MWTKMAQSNQEVLKASGEQEVGFFMTSRTTHQFYSKFNNVFYFLSIELLPAIYLYFAGNSAKNSAQRFQVEIMMWTVNSSIVSI